jgi:ATP-binding cassette subfamily C protein CydC
LARVRLWVFDRLAALGPLPALELHSGDALRRFVGDVDELQNLYVRAFSPLTVALFVAALVSLVLHTVDAALAWIVLAYLCVSGLAVPALVALCLRGLGRQEAARRATLVALLIDAVQGLQDLLLSGRREEHLERIAALDRELNRIERRVAGFGAVRVAGGDLLANLAMWTAIAVLVPLLAHGSVSRSALPVVAFLVLASFEATQPLGIAFQSLDHVRAAGERIFNVTDAKPSVVSPPDPLPVPPRPALIFEHVSFSYVPGALPCLLDISFALRPNDTQGGPEGTRGPHKRTRRLAVVGPSGSGKTTLVRLALRMANPTAGRVLLGGHDLAAYRVEDVRSQVSVVDQNTHIFNDTIRGNLLVGKPSATDAELWRALETARLAEAVEQMPAGLDTWVGEQGLLLAGGERQRLAIARAVLRDAPILILDEPTANLDTLTEREVLEALQTLMADRATLMITHRLVGMERMDEILVLDHGRLVQRGTHDELRRADGLYSRMLAIQEDLLFVL